MNKPIPQAELEMEARMAAAEEFAIARHYINMIIGHLEIADDAGAIWDMEQFKGAGRRAFAAFAPIRTGIIERGRDGRRGAAE